MSRIPPRQVLGFIAIGVLGLISDVGTFNLAIWLGARPVYASLLGFVLGATVSFVGNKVLTFSDRQVANVARAYLTFFAINVVAVSVVQVVVWVGESMDLSLAALNFWRLVAIGVVTIGRFFAYRTWVFKLTPELRASG